jgi:hypothetical protein
VPLYTLNDGLIAPVEVVVTALACSILGPVVKLHVTISVADNISNVESKLRSQNEEKKILLLILKSYCLLLCQKLDSFILSLCWK